MTQSFAEAHPSEPNYLALFSGNTFGLTSDACPVNAGAAPNLGFRTVGGGIHFRGLFRGPARGRFARVQRRQIRPQACAVGQLHQCAAASSLPFSAFNNRSDYASLPTVSFVIPNLDNDMHDGTIAQADTWLSNNLSHYANWAVANNSLLIITFDEDDGGSKNQIPTVIYGAHVKPGTYSEPISHYNVLSTIEEMYGLPKTGLAANAPAISDIWA